MVPIERWDGMVGMVGVGGVGEWWVWVCIY